MDKKKQNMTFLNTNIFIKTCKTYSQQYSLDVKFLSMANVPNSFLFNK